MTTLVWIQREFRLSALPALQAALESPGEVIVAYFHDPQQVIGEANLVWLAHSLQTLQAEIRAKGGVLWIVSGAFESKLTEIVLDYQVKQLFYSFQVGQPFSDMQAQALSVCQSHQVALHPFYSEFLMTPGELLNQKNTPYLVFTPFYKALRSKQSLMVPLTDNVGDLSRCLHSSPPVHFLSLPKALSQLIARPWAKKIMADTNVGEQTAWHRLQAFIENTLEDYDQDRDFPSLAATSQLSTYLHFGQINIRDIYFYMQSLIEEGRLSSSDAMPWLRQLAWKEFARHLLFHFPDTETQAFQTKYRTMQWQHDQPSYQAWQKGLTGIPIIDAGMRELWETGTMHNRVRMLVASFLTKNLNQHWLMGKAWFDHTLFDADPANNTMGWQWVAGCGVDAAPYYRLFNPVTQSLKFDAQGRYLRQWLPELAQLSNKAIHAPWEHKNECDSKGVTLGQDYPLPLVDLTQSRQLHLARVAAMKGTV